MILFLFAVLTVASGRVYPRSGVSEDVEGLMYEIPEYEDPELVLFNLAARGALPVLKLMQGAKGYGDLIKEKDTARYLKIADVKKGLDEIISGLQEAKNKGKHNLLMEIINAMQYLMKLKYHLSSIDISKIEEDDETSPIFRIPNKYSSTSKTSEKSSVTSDNYDKSSLVSDTSGESSIVSDTSGESPIVSDTSNESVLASDTSDDPLASDISEESPLASDSSDEPSLLSDTSDKPTVSPDQPVQHSAVSDVSADHSAESIISYEHIKNSDVSRDRYLSPYSLIHYIPISDSPSDKLLTSDIPAEKKSVSDIPAVMSFISDFNKSRYSSSDDSSKQDSDPREEEAKKEVAKDESILVESTVKPQVSPFSSDAEDNGYVKKVKTLVKDNTYISESNQDEHAATIMSKKLTWKLRGIVEKPQF